MYIFVCMYLNIYIYVCVYYMRMKYVRMDGVLVGVSFLKGLVMGWWQDIDIHGMVKTDGISVWYAINRGDGESTWSWISKYTWLRGFTNSKPFEHIARWGMQAMSKLALGDLPVASTQDNQDCCMVILRGSLLSQRNLCNWPTGDLWNESETGLNQGIP